MEFVFQLSDYHDPALDGETAELLRQRLEAYSRQAMPRLWKVTDRLNAHTADTAARRRKRYRVYGVILIALGVFALVPGLTEPRIPGLILAGSFATAWGLWSLFLRERKPPAPPPSCCKEAAGLLEDQRRVNWKEAQGMVRVDEAGVTWSAGDICETVPYGEITGVFETERLWMLTCWRDLAMLLQKKDLVSGKVEDFLPYLQGKIAN